MGILQRIYAFCELSIAKQIGIACLLSLILTVFTILFGILLLAAAFGGYSEVILLMLLLPILPLIHPPVFLYALIDAKTNVILPSGLGPILFLFTLEALYILGVLHFIKYLAKKRTTS